MKKTNNQEIDFSIPSSKEIECQILAELVQSSDLIPLAQTIISDCMFSVEEYANLWRTLVDMKTKGMTIDLTTINDRTDKQTIVSLLNPKFGPGVGSSLSVVDHCNALKNASIRRSIFLSAYRMIQVATDNSESIENLIAMPGQLVEDIENGPQIGTATRRINEVLDNLAESFEIIQNQRNKGKRTRIPTGFSFLDYLTYSGFNAGDLVILSARPSVGKTAVMLQMAKTATKHNFPATIYSLEMTNENLGQRLIFSTGFVTPTEISEGTAKWNDIERANGEFNELPLFFNDKARTLEDITTDIVANHQRGKCDIAFIDYLGLIQSSNSRQPLYQAIAERTARLKQIAKQCNIPIVLLCQLNRASDSENRSPELRDLRDCGSIEQDADIVLMLERESKNLDDHNLKMWVRKNRNGRAGNICINLVGNSTFTEFQ